MWPNDADIAPETLHAYAKRSTATAAQPLRAGPTEQRAKHNVRHVSRQLGPAWGRHADDVDLALGDLVADVAASGRACPRSAGR